MQITIDPLADNSSNTEGDDSPEDITFPLSFFAEDGSEVTVLLHTTTIDESFPYYGYYGYGGDASDLFIGSLDNII